MNSPTKPPKLTLRLKDFPNDVIDGSALLPQNLATKSTAEIASLPLLGGQRAYRVDELFEIDGVPSEQVIIHGDCRGIERLGESMVAGSLTIFGNVGNDVAAGLAGGHVEIFGDVGHRLGTGLRRGRILVRGNVGDDAFGPNIGSPRGMLGGDCIVLGNIGERVGERMRRGVILVTGDALDYGATQMIAGTMIILGSLGQHWAEGMRRGTIVITEEHSSAFAAELTAPREFELSFLPILWRYVSSLLGPSETIRLPTTRWARRQLGDRCNQGVGEVLTLTRHGA